MSKDTFAEYRKQKRSADARGLLTRENGLLALLALLVAVVWWFAWPKYFAKARPAGPRVMATATDTLPEPAQPYEPPDKFTAVFFDVGQGDAAAFFTPGGAVFVVDGGEGGKDNRDSPYNRAMDAGNTVILPYLAKLNVHELAAVFLTHPHSDHYGGLVDVLRGVTVRAFYDPGKSAGAFGYKNLLQMVRQRHIDNYVNPQPGEEIELDDQLKVRVLAADGNAENINNSSLVLKLTYGGVGFLLTGDAEVPVEEKMLAGYRGELRSAVLKVGHHGSRTSSSAAFLQAVQPRFAVISVGSYNHFGHPTPEVVARLRGAGAQTMRTDERGTITFTTSGNINDLQVTMERESGAAVTAASTERSGE